MSESKFKSIYGTRDILPHEASSWRQIMAAVDKIASNANYGFILPPIFEMTELFARGIGEASDIVSKEMYTFRDQGDRSLTLRPEGTASVVRAYLEHSLSAKEGLVKVWYAGPMFRQERPQAGRLRQFYQFGVEAIGSLDPALDAEVIDVNYRILVELGITDLAIKVNSIGMPEDRQAHRRAFSEFVTPNLAKFCPDCQKRFATNPLRMFDCKEPTCRRLLEGAPVVLEYLSHENKGHFDKVLGYLESLDIPFEVDARLVRGLDYYTRTAWEIKSAKLGAQDSLSGGGRYDKLVEQLGGPPTPAIGFAAGMERIIMATPEMKSNSVLKRPGTFIVTAGDKYRPEAVKLAAKIRMLGLAADIDYLGKSLKGQMKQADKSRFAHAVILADEEMGRGKIVVRNLANSEQTEVELDRFYAVQNADRLGEIFGREG
jgi:histidyl-tRNA synthetase